MTGPGLGWAVTDTGGLGTPVPRQRVLWACGLEVPRSRTGGKLLIDGWGGRGGDAALLYACLHILGVSGVPPLLPFVVPVAWSGLSRRGD